jgi:hypothetical protein
MTKWDAIWSKGSNCDIGCNHLHQHLKLLDANKIEGGRQTIIDVGVRVHDVLVTMQVMLGLF